MNWVISTSNEEIDMNFGGGLPLPSLMLIEGDHGSGKSAFTAQIIKGMLDSGMKVTCITENMPSDYIRKMKSITFDFSKAFFKNDLSIVSFHSNQDWAKKSPLMLPVIGDFIEEQFQNINCVVIDSLSFLTMHNDTNTILDFLTKCKHLVARGMSVVLTMHPNSMPQDIGLRLKSLCDVYLVLKTTNIGDRAVKVMNIVKLIGATMSPDSGFAFNVDSTFGIKIVPISMASV